MSGEEPNAAEAGALAERRALAARIVDHLARHEAENNLPIGVAAGIADGIRPSEGAELLLTTDPAGSGAALLMTPPYRLIVGYGDDDAAREALLEDMYARGVIPPGVVGPEPAAGEVAAWWAGRLGRMVRRGLRLGVYRLESVTPAVRTQGSIRIATASDEDLLVAWLTDFCVEARVAGDNPRDMFLAFMAGSYRRLYVFEVGSQSVCIAGVGGRTPRGRRLGPVYTPPEHRRKGYAEALVAAVSSEILAAGSQFCFLFTDLDNPTSNAVYERIGYEFVIESAEYDLV